MQVLNEYLENALQQMALPGLDCSVWHRGQEVYRFTRGFRPDAVFHIYSNTKVIVCTAALQMMEQGKFALDDPIAAYFPEMENLTVRTETGLEAAEAPITIRDLFRMTSGIGGSIIPPDMGRQLAEETNGYCRPIHLPPYIAQTPLEHQPGSRFCYGIGHELLAALVEKFSGQLFSAYLNEHIFAPLGITDTTFDEASLPAERIVCQYRYEESGEKTNLGNGNVLVPSLLKECASGGLVSTTDDYCKFQEALCTGEKLLKRSTVDLMRTNQLSGRQWEGYWAKDIGLGYGLGVRTVMDPTTHGAKSGLNAFGWGGAAGTYGSIDPENQLNFFCAVQVFGIDCSPLHRHLHNLIYSIFT